MNSMSGSLAQYTQIYWGGEIALYLFLAGLSAGAMIVAVLLRRAGLAGLDLKGSVLAPGFKAAVLTAPLAIVLGLGLLVLDLGKPLSFTGYC